MTRKRAAATLSADSSRMTGRIEKPESRGALMWHNTEAVSKSLLRKKKEKKIQAFSSPTYEILARITYEIDSRVIAN